MECSIRDSLSEADMRLVINCANHACKAMNEEVERLNALPENSNLPHVDEYKNHLQWVERMASVNIACLLYNHPQVGFSSSGGSSLAMPLSSF